MSIFSRDGQRDDGDRFAYWALLVLVVLAPMYVYTAANMSPIVTKITLVSVLALASLILYVVAHMRTQELSAPRSLLLCAAWLLPLAYTLSTLFASENGISMFGKRVSMDSVAFMLVAALVLTLAAVLLTSQKRALGVYLALVGAAALVSVCELVLFFARDMVAATGAVLPSLSVLGSLNDLAVFFGLIIIFVLLSLLILPVTQILKTVLLVVLVVATYFLMVVNLEVLWWILGLFALSAFVFSVTRNYFVPSAGTRVSFAALAIVAVSATFIFASDSIVGMPAQWASVGELDVRPSWQTTISIGKMALTDHAVLGTGPGTFERIWSAYMPPEIQTTEYWLTNFTYGVGFIPTSVITTGLVGALAWGVFFAVFLIQGVRSLILGRVGGQGDVSQYLRTTSFLAALYLWVVTLIQVPSPAIVLYAFLLTGVFIASLTFGTEPVRMLHIAFRDNPRIGFLATLAGTVAVLVSFGGVYQVTTRFLAESSYQQAMKTINTNGDFVAAEQFTTRALTLHPVDAYYRLLSNLDLVRLQQLLAENKAPEEIREPAQALLSRAIGNAQKALEYDVQDYQNWLNLGTLYQNIIPLGIEGSAESAIAAFDRTIVLRPAAAHVYLAKATVERARGNTELAQSNIQQAITLRNTYTDAIFFLAQLQLEQNDVSSALKSVEAVTIFEPRNSVAFFQLGLLRYGLNDFAGAVQALEKALSITPEYANARYFLGLSYWRLGDTPRSQAEFEKVQATNPENTEVATILSNLREGKPPFVSTSASDDIESRNGLPVVDAPTPATEAPKRANLTP